MKAFDLKEMKKGYFIGDFVPNVMASKDVEVCIRGASKYTLDAAYFREKDTRVVYIFQGEIEVDGKVYKKGNALLFEPGDIINIFALKNTEMVVMNFPGTKGDLHRVVWRDYDEMDQFYNGYLKKLLNKHTTYLPDHIETKVDPKDISVVIQGYYDPSITPNTIKSVRKYLPGAKIIVSTWKECNCTDAECDLLIQSEDPGACECGLYADLPISNNGNRQILSTKAGLDAIKTKYAFKLRSDLILLGDDILRCFDMFEEKDRNPEYSIFFHRIVIGELFTRNAFIYHDTNGKIHKVPKPFHPSDWFYFGYTDDLRVMYENIDLIPSKEMADYTCKYPDIAHKNKYKYSWRFTTEQHILLGCVKKKFPDLRFDDWTDWDEENINLSEKIMMNNFAIMNFCQHKILNMKYVPESYANSGIYYKEKALMTNKQMREYYGISDEK